MITGDLENNCLKNNLQNSQENIFEIFFFFSEGVGLHSLSPFHSLFQQQIDRTQSQMLSSKFYKIFRCILFTEHLLKYSGFDYSQICYKIYFLLQHQETNRTPRINLCYNIWRAKDNFEGVFMTFVKLVICFSKYHIVHLSHP